MSSQQNSSQKVKKAVKTANRVAQAVRMVVRALRFVVNKSIQLASIFISIGWPAVIFVVIIVIIAVGASSAASLGDKLSQIAGISKQDLSFLDDIDPKILKEIRKETKDDVIAAFDCSNYSPSERQPGVNCIPGLLASEQAAEQGPIPERAEYLVPVWQAAAKRYQVPWQLLAAVNATRTNFGWINCKRKDGIGFYRHELEAFSEYSVNGGSTPLRNEGLGCKKVRPYIIQGVQPEEEETGSKKKKKSKASPELQITAPKEPLKQISDDKSAGGGDPYDPVDAAFTTARMLAANGGFKAEEWIYAGSPSGQCTTSKSDGRTWYLPETGIAGFGSGAALGFNENLNIPRSLVVLAAKYRSDTGKYKPRRSGSGEDSQLGYHPIPKADIIKLLTGAWFAFGVRGQELNANVTANFAQIGLESGGRPYIMQGYIGDVNDDNPAGGLMQFIPGTFDHWNVDGFNDRFNPLDNILATVNAQVNGPYPILNGSSGWSPPFSTNPYSTGGKFTLVGPGTLTGAGSEPVKAKPYNGEEQTDRVSKAVSYKGAGGKNSACYVAVVNEWYEAIVEHPPPGLSLSGPLRNRIIELARRELKRGVHEVSSGPYYTDTNKISPYNIGSSPWCAAFASWIWYQAGVKEMGKLPGMTQAGGLTLPSHVDTMTSWGQLKGTYSTDKPEPGDFAIYGSAHVELVEKVSPDGQVISTIGGNTSDAVSRVTAPSGITHFVSPPDDLLAEIGSLPAGEGSLDLEAGGNKAGIVKKAADRYNVPFWIMWGIAGAESTWGRVGDNLFGLLAAADGADTTSWEESSMQAAKTMRGLKDTYDTWRSAMKHYSGHNYGLDHVKQLAKQQPTNI